MELRLQLTSLQRRWSFAAPAKRATSIIETMSSEPANDDERTGYLVLLSSQHAGERVTLPRSSEPPFVFGRSIVDVGLTVRGDGSIARHHFSLHADGAGGHVIEDRKSTNGTFINRARVKTARLADGDEIRAGGVLFRYFCGPGAARRAEDARATLAKVDPWTGLPRTAGPNAVGLRVDRRMLSRAAVPEQDVIVAVARLLARSVGPTRSLARVSYDTFAVWPADGLPCTPSTCLRLDLEYERLTFINLVWGRLP